MSSAHESFCPRPPLGFLRSPTDAPKCPRRRLIPETIILVLCPGKQMWDGCDGAGGADGKGVLGYGDSSELSHLGLWARVLGKRKVQVCSLLALPVSHSPATSVSGSSSLPTRAKSSAEGSGTS